MLMADSCIVHIYTSFAFIDILYIVNVFVHSRCDAHVLTRFGLRVKGEKLPAALGSPCVAELFQSG